MEKNIERYKYYLLLKNASFIGPIITIFFLMKELSYLEIMLIATVFKFAVAILEVPTGTVADHFGYKKSMLLGFLIMGLTLTFYPIGSGFIYFMLAEVMFAVGIAFVSGADTALLYESLKVANREKDYAEVLGKASQYAFFMQIIGSIASVFLYKIYFGLPYILSGVLILLGALVVLSFVEKDTIHHDSLTFKKYFLHIRDSGKYIFHHKKLRTIILFAGLVSMFFGSIYNLYAPYFIATEVSVVYFGFIFAGFNVVAFFTSKYANLFMKITKSRTLIIMASLLLLSFLIQGTVYHYIGILAICLQQIYRAINKTIYTKYINKNVETAKRATVLSFHSLFSTLLTAGFSIIIGLLMQRFNIFNTNLILGAILGAIMLVMYFVLNKNLGKKEIV